jgi:hypothetical protein
MGFPFGHDLEMVNSPYFCQALVEGTLMIIMDYFPVIMAMASI